MSVMPARIRSATPHDIEDVLAIWRSAGSAAAGTPPDTPELVAGLLARDPGSLLLAEIDGDGIVGTLIVGFDGWRGALHRLVVTPPQRRQGIARALVDAGHDRLRELGAVRVGVHVADDHGALSFWDVVGYEHHVVHRMVRAL
jgi:ribosomal protein S18 acetylase RimI-like enzyme